MFFEEIRVDILVIFWYFFCIPNTKEIPKNCSNIHRYFFKNHDITGKYVIYQQKFGGFIQDNLQKFLKLKIKYYNSRWKWKQNIIFLYF